MSIYVRGLALVATILLGACGGGGGGGGGDGGGGGGDVVGALAVKILSGLAEAKGLVLTGATTTARAGGFKVDCTDENGDEGTVVTINGTDYCQADLRPETLYAVDENGVLVRVRYLDADGNEVASTKFRPQYVRALDNGFVFARIRDPDTFEDYGIFARASDGAVFRIERELEPFVFSVENFYDANASFSDGWQDILRARASDVVFTSRTNTYDENGFFVSSSERASLFRAPQADTASDELRVDAVSPASQNPYSFLLPDGGNRIVYNREGGDVSFFEGSEITVLDMDSGGFNTTTFGRLPTVFTDGAGGGSDQPIGIRGLDGGLYVTQSAGLVRDDDDSDGFVASCLARLYALRIDDALAVAAELVDEAETVIPTPEDNVFGRALCPGFARSEGAAAGDVWAAVGPGLVLTTDYSGSTPQLGFVELPELRSAGFVPDDNQPVVAGTRYIYASGTDDADDAVYRLDPSENYDATRLPLDGYQIDRLEPYANDSVVIYATDKSNGDTVVLRADADLAIEELSRDDSNTFVSFQRID